MPRIRQASRLAAAIALLTAAPARADITIGGITFRDDAFADVLLASSGAPTFAGAATLGAAVTGHEPGSWADLLSSAQSVTLGFTDDVIVNGPGNDQAIFTLFAPRPINRFLVLPGSVHRATLATSFTGTTNPAGVPVNVALLDLDGLLAPGATLDRVMIAGGDENGLDAPNQLAAVGALNAAAVPEPTTLALLAGGVAVVGLGALRRRPAGSG